MTERSSALRTDLYQINMMQAYLDRGRPTRRSLNCSPAICRPGAARWYYFPERSLDWRL